MKLPFFASFIVFCAWLSYEIYKNNTLREKMTNAFWEREEKANATRRKPLDDLNYITIPIDTFPTSTLAEREDIAECQSTISFLCNEKIVNFTGISNTDLKLKYGAPNIDLLARYDNNYTALVRTLHKWADILYQEHYAREACTLLEFSVSTGSDISNSYRLLIKIYQELDQTSKIKELIPIAESLNSAMKKSILEIIEQGLAASA